MRQLTFKKNELFVNREKRDLNKNNDLFGITDKGDVIINVLQEAEELKGNNMLALYGDWGSGKTSLMMYIMNNLNLKRENDGKQPFKFVFFEAWKYERDENLALSLLEQIAAEILKDDKFNEIKGELEEIVSTVLTFGKNMLLNSKVQVLGIDIGLGQAGKDTIKEMEEQDKKVSLYYQYEAFKKKFSELEKKVNEKYSNLIVFIDDLDRCEPKNILNLLSSIKLFFVHNENFIYFSGIDKEAVKKSIELKYNNIIKSNEYLEKIFDITFNMPQVSDFKRIIERYFKDSEVKDEGNSKYKYIDNINCFFEHIGFTVPRHIKKVFNKFELLRRFKNMTQDENLPNIDDDKNIVLIIVTLYLIILHDYYKVQFDELLSYDKINSLYNFSSSKNKSFNITKNMQVTIKDIIDKVNNNTPISAHNIRIVSSYDDIGTLFYIIILFLPRIEKEYDIYPDIKYDVSRGEGYNNIYEFINQFYNYGSRVQIGFIKFLIHMHENINDYDSKSDNDHTTIQNLVNFVRMYL